MDEQIEKLEHMYKDNEYMLKRLNYHITQILPKTLENEKQTWEQRQERNKYLTGEQQKFIQIFLSNNDYYYLPGNATFYEYNKITYSVIKEDDVHHKLLSSISKDRKLLVWKHKTKFILLKQIKERNLFQSIPETETIQHVINTLTPSLFQDKIQTKYFLTILGDNILKKMGDKTFLVKPKMKPLLQELDQLSATFNISNICGNIMTKYHESYSYQNCRLLKINNAEPNIFTNLGINLFCIAAYYSYNRYTSSENYLIHVASQEQRDYSLFLKNNTQQTIVESFCKYALEEYALEEYALDPVVDIIEIYKSKVSISWKKMHYIWKLYISKNSLPFMFYSNTLKILLKERLNNYDEVTDTFYGVTSKYLPCVQKFLHFWDETITQSEFGVDVDELTDLFNKWTKNESKNESKNDIKILEQDIIKIINHFYPANIIESGKTILNIKCSLWDKNIDIELSLNSLKEINKMELILIDDAYKYYLKFCRKNKCINVVNKQYFEKYVKHTLTQFIEFDKFISASKWTSEVVSVVPLSEAPLSEATLSEAPLS